MYILPHSAKCDYRLVQEDTEAMVRNSAPENIIVHGT